MKSPLKSRILLISIVLLLSLSMLWEFFPMPDASERLQNLPEKGLYFTGQTLPLTELEVEMLGQARAVKMLYNFKGRRYLLMAIDGTHNRNAVHDPTYCFRGEGYSIQEVESAQLPSGQAKLLHLRRDQHSAEALYWFSTGPRSYSSLWRYGVDSVTRRLTLGLSGPEPILILLRPLDGPADWAALNTTFLPQLHL